MYRSQLRFPIHFRYQPPSPDSAYTPVVIPAPLVFILQPVGVASLPCHPYTRDTCLWELLTHGDQKEAELHAEIPCGLQNTFSYFVIGSTTLVTLASTIFIIHAMAKIKSHA